MNAPPMRPWQNAIALIATLLAAAALLPLPAGARLVFAGIAVATIVLLLVVRLRSHRVRKDATRVSGVYDRIERIRSERARRRER